MGRLAPFFCKLIGIWIGARYTAVQCSKRDRQGGSCVLRETKGGRMHNHRSKAMNSPTIQMSDIGPIREAEIALGDLTVLVGPQASGKSILLQFAKLLVDTGAVLAALKRYGLEWRKDVRRFLDIYLGEGMGSVWNDTRSRLAFHGKPVELDSLVARQKKTTEETMFFIPAQRVLTLRNGWPRPFADYSPGDPFAVRDFSEKVRQLLESDIGRAESLFPQTRRLKKSERQLLTNTVFSQFQLQVDRQGMQRRLVLTPSKTGDSLPFMVWSAGQREFAPLLLGFYWLLPPTKVARRGDLRWVVIEELEMGLHPRAISTVLLLVLDLLARGYRVCLSTHSPHVLDVVWALRICQKHQADPLRLLDLFEVSATGPMRTIARKVLDKQARVYYFDAKTGRTQDISDLDPGARNAGESGWGGLTEFSGRAADIVARVVGGSEE